MGLLAWEGGWRILKMRDEPTQNPHELPRERLDGMRGGKGKEGATRTRGEARSKPGRAGNMGPVTANTAYGIVLLHEHCHRTVLAWSFLLENMQNQHIGKNAWETCGALDCGCCIWEYAFQRMGEKQ